MLNAERYASNILAGNEEAKRGEYLAFLEKATPENKAEVAKALNLEDLDSTDFDTFTDARIKYLYSEEGRKAVSTVTKTRKAAEAVPANEKAAPKLVSTALADGVHRYGGENGIAIIVSMKVLRTDGTSLDPLVIRDAYLLGYEEGAAPVTGTTTGTQNTTATNGEGEGDAPSDDMPILPIVGIAGGAAVIVALGIFFFCRKKKIK